MPKQHKKKMKKIFDQNPRIFRIFILRIFVLLSKLFGLIPFSFRPTAQLILCLSLALSVFGAVFPEVDFALCLVKVFCFKYKTFPICFWLDDFLLQVLYIMTNSLLFLPANLAFTALRSCC